jgi:uncharacterized membrane protein
LNTYRLKSIDLLRGLVMIIMALDHTRDYFHFDAFLHDPLNPATTSLPLYFTRWITHFCAPVFVFLAGTSSYLQGLRKSRKELSALLVSRGLWLVVVEIFIMSFAFTFDIHYGFILLQVIWVTGISLVALGILIWLPFNVIFVLGILIVSGHNLLDYAEAGHQGKFNFTWDLAHKGNFGGYAVGGHRLAILYPFLPWTGLLLVGYCSGKIFQSTIPADARKKILYRTGAALIFIFFCLRALNIYGDPRPWNLQHNALQNFFSFMNVSKYPPSLLFMCITIGPALLFLAAAETAKNKLSDIITVYGRVPFLYYVIHFYLLHLLTTLFFFMRGHSIAEGLQGVPNFPFCFLIAGEGVHLWQVYVIWISVVTALYPVCKWFSSYKMMHRKWWLSYL